MAVPGGPTCVRCGAPLRWVVEWGVWGCDRCRVTYPPPAAPPQAVTLPQAMQYGQPASAPPGYAHPPPAPAGAGRKKAMMIGGAVAVVGGVGVVLGLTLGGGGHGGKATPDALLQAAVDAAIKGDVDGVLALEGANDFGSYLECKDAKVKQRMMDSLRSEKRHGLARDLERWKNLEVTVAKVEAKGDPHVEKADGAEGGGSYGGCRTTADVTEQKFKAELTVRGAKATKDEKVTIEFRGVKVGSTWYLDELPDPPSGDIGTMREFRDQVCACKDKACADGVQRDFDLWSKSMADKYKDRTPSEDEMKEAERVLEDYTNCTMKLETTSDEPPVPPPPPAPTPAPAPTATPSGKSSPDEVAGATAQAAAAGDADGLVALFGGAALAAHAFTCPSGNGSEIVSDFKSYADKLATEWKDSGVTVTRMAPGERKVRHAGEDFGDCKVSVDLELDKCDLTLSYRDASGTTRSVDDSVDVMQLDGQWYLVGFPSRPGS